MKIWWKQFLAIALVICLTGCSINPGAGQKKEGKYQKELGRTALYGKNIPSDYLLMDFRKRALAFDRLVFDENREGPYLPLNWEDTTYESFGLPAYVGDGRMYKDGEQEAVTVIASVLSATQLGIDKSNQNGINYVKMISAFYSEEEKIILNNPSGSSETTSMWYLLYPAILFAQVSILYPEETDLRNQMLNTIESWYQAYKTMKETGTFDYTGFNFKTGKPYKNNIWIEPDCAAGISLLLYYGYELTGEEKYRDGAEYGIEYVSTYFGSSLYEALLYFAPYLAAKLNVQFETDFSVEKLLNDVLNGNSIPRGGWGSMTGNWGSYDVNGLMGSTTDGGGYGFSMNTFAAAYALSPVAKYDTRYAASLGKWYLNLSGNSRYFFADQTPKENQSAALSEKASSFSEQTGNAVPYEGIRKSQNSRTPWFGGDPTVYGWAETDFSLYSGAHMGLFASIVEATDVESILRIDMNRGDLFHKTYPAYLLYNPYEEEKAISYRIESKQIVDLYNSVTKEYLAKGVSEETKIILKPEDAAVVLEFPADSGLTHEGISYKIGDNIIGADGASLTITSHEANDTVSGTFRLEADCISTYPGDKVKEAVITVKEKEYRFDDLSDMKLSAKEWGGGSITLFLHVVMESGLSDETQLRLMVKS